MEKTQFVWIFNEVSRRYPNFPGGVFLDRTTAEGWIRKYLLSGTLTKYPLNISVYDWAVDTGIYRPKKDSEISSAFIGAFTSASQEHYHYESGILLN